ncbi:hypothetical protein [Denitromonas iodatirespirans]|uniref:Uncharacterized protein n=1 Tax=Denitromonas iodatirespirans TaxID=2795389 RepID=A0A944D4D0_DENI1|nr:hypothetical protein [Denitromonas iodatirespirans]MBT0959714.1 hypothetical protein [Denitromonas iodatirespirans]
MPADAPRLSSHWLDASGGLGYHWRALRYRQRLWLPFARQVGRWLEAWHPPTTDLVLVGPSAGYALDTAFLDRFARITVLEPDRLARMLLRRRFPAASLRMADIDIFALPDGPAALAHARPDAAILFCNVIGQRLDADTAPPWRQVQQAALSGHHWASWHDVFSAPRPPHRLPEPTGHPDGAAVARRLWAGMACEVVDHGTLGWGPAADYALWQLTPRQWQVIEWVRHAPTPPADLTETGRSPRPAPT